MEATRRIDELMIPGPAGTLEALLEWVPGTSPRLATLVCHPHPKFGGTMHNKVVFRAAKTAAQLDLPALRFNFRGVGKSQGEYAGGIGERDDVRAALDYLASRFADTRVCLMGFSFGSWVGLEVGSEDPRVVALAGLGLPVASTDFSYLARATKPKLIVQGTEDIYAPRGQIEQLFRDMPEPKRMHWVEGADHFFTGRLDEVQSTIQAFLQEILGKPAAKAK